MASSYLLPCSSDPLLLLCLLLPSCVVHLQTGPPDARVEAKEPTGDAIRDLLGKVWDAIKERPEWQPLLQAGLYPIYSLDQATIHRAAIKDWDNVNTGWRVVRDEHGAVLHGAHGQQLSPMGTVLLVPPRSPDLHQVIEHSHALVCRALRLELDKKLNAGEHDLEKTLTFDAMNVLLPQCFKQACTVRVIKKNVAKLVWCYRRVSQLKGHSPEARYR